MHGFCGACGAARVSAEQRFCRDCGAPLAAPSAAAAETPPVVEPAQVAEIAPVAPSPGWTPAPRVRQGVQFGDVAIPVLIGLLVTVVGFVGGSFAAEHLSNDLFSNNHFSLGLATIGFFLALVGVLAAVATRVAGGVRGASWSSGGAGLLLAAPAFAAAAVWFLVVVLYEFEVYDTEWWIRLVGAATAALVALLGGLLMRAPGLAIGAVSLALGGAVFALIALGSPTDWRLGNPTAWVLLVGFPVVLLPAAAWLAGAFTAATSTEGSAPTVAPTGVPRVPTPGQPQWTPAPGGTNGFAITSMVLGIVGVSFLSLIFGFVALSQLKRNPQQGGRGMAITGIVVSCCWIVAVVVGTIVLYNMAQDATYDYMTDY